jgi:FMN phosphatase YigB (HAD superfamily)
MAAVQYQNNIFDLGGVFFHFDSHPDSSISGLQFKAVLASPTWHRYECSLITQQECYDTLSTQFNFAPEELRHAINLAATTLRFDEDLVAFVQGLKEKSGDKLRVFAMSNVSGPDFEILREVVTKWGIFERVFTSSEAGKRKPEFGFYEYVLQEIGAEASEVVFVDDTPENVIVAESLGLHGVVFRNVKTAMRALKNVMGSPLRRAEEYLRRNQGSMFTRTSTGITIRENFSQLLILHATDDRYVFSIRWSMLELQIRWKSFLSTC